MINPDESFLKQSIRDPNLAAGTYNYEKLNPDLYAPPGTDAGDMPNLMWPMGLSHNRAGTGRNSGFARQQNTAVLPAAVAMAGVDMRLAPHAYRELHWHTANEWALMLKGWYVPYMPTTPLRSSASESKSLGID